MRAGKVETLVNVLMGLEFQIESSGDKTVVVVVVDNNMTLSNCRGLDHASGDLNLMQGGQGMKIHRNGGLRPQRETPQHPLPEYLSYRVESGDDRQDYYI